MGKKCQKRRKKRRKNRRNGKESKRDSKEDVAKGFDHETVMEITGIQKEELEKLASISH
jgi:hypothetical protein